MDKDQHGLLLAHVWALRGTCHRRQVGCVLFDRDGYQLASGYNGRSSGQPHCNAAASFRCEGADLPSGQGLDLCEAIHAEANALLRCADVRQIWTAFVTHSPCVHCVKLLMNTGCRRIVFSEPYAHDAAARALWTGSRPPRRLDHADHRTWEHRPLHFNAKLDEILT